MKIQPLNPKNTATIPMGLLLILLFSCHGLMTQPESYHQVAMEILADGFEIPWAIEVISEDEYLFTERMGGLYHYQKGEVTRVSGIPDSKTYRVDREYGGMMEVSLHPQFASNRWVYLSYVYENYHLDVARFRLVEHRAVDLELIFRSDQFCIGSRIAWQDDQHFFLTFGVGGAPKPDPGPQDLSDPRGKIFRLMADGSIPEDNPVFSDMGGPTGIWSYGHRDPQGLHYDKEDSKLYASEHGPLGGDELNLIEKGGNYGWPLFSYGSNYDMTPVSNLTEEEASKQTILPMKYWESDFRLAPGNLIKLEGSNFTGWNGTFLMGALTYQHLVSYHPDTDETKVLIPKVGRIRDIAQLPSGDLVVLIEKSSPAWLDKGRVVRIKPKNNN